MDKKSARLGFFAATTFFLSVGAFAGQITLNGSGSNATVVQSSSSGNFTLTLPSSAGSTGQVLMTSGSGGNLSWATMNWTPVAKSADYSIQTTDLKTFFIVTGTTLLTLPSPSAVGSGYMVGFNNNGSGTVTVGPNASETINGSASATLAAGETATLITDGTNWFFFNRKSASGGGGGGTSCSVPDQQVFNSSGTWTKPSCGTKTQIQCWGGGGGGGGGSSANAHGGGGGGGGYATLVADTSSLGSTEIVTIGAGGSAGGSSGSNGTAGGNSSVGSWVIAYGGAYGIGATGSASGGGGGGGGAGSTGSAGSAGATTTGGAGGGPNGGAGASANNDGSPSNIATSATYAGTVVDNGGAVAWTTPANAATSDDTYATRTVAVSTTTNYLVASNFGFAVPSTAVVTGIMVEWEKKTNTSTNSKDAAVRIVKGGAIGTMDRSSATSWSTTDTFSSYGGSSDLWGQTWTPADINSSTFGAALAGKNTNTSSTRNFSVDSVRITVYYAGGGGGGGGGGSSSSGGNGGSATFGGGGGGGGLSSGGNDGTGNGGSSIWGGGGGGGAQPCCTTLSGRGGTSQAAGAGGIGAQCDSSDTIALEGLAPGGGGGGGGDCSGALAAGDGAGGRCIVTTY